MRFFQIILDNKMKWLALLVRCGANIFNQQKKMPLVRRRGHKPEMPIKGRSGVVFCMNSKGAYPDDVGGL